MKFSRVSNGLLPHGLMVARLQCLVDVTSVNSGRVSIVVCNSGMQKDYMLRLLRVQKKKKKYCANGKAVASGNRTSNVPLVRLVPNRRGILR